MESIGQSGQGYPEETPGEVAGDTPPGDRSEPEENVGRARDRERTPSTDDGRATGSPSGAGAGEEPAEQPGLPGSST